MQQEYKSAPLYSHKHTVYLNDKSKIICGLNTQAGIQTLSYLTPGPCFIPC